MSYLLRVIRPCPATRRSSSTRLPTSLHFGALRSRIPLLSSSSRRLHQSSLHAGQPSSYPPERTWAAFSRRIACRHYYTEHSSVPAPYPPTETAILTAALEHVPVHGFTDQAITQGALDAGYVPASINLFPRGAFDLLLYYLVTKRLELKTLVQFPSLESQASRPLGTGAKVRALLLARLRANEPIIHQYTGALALMSLGGNIPASTAELARLADEIWYLAGDVSVDTSWYTKRALLSGVYASAEVFMTQDKSANFIETEKFVDRRLDEVKRAGGAVGAIGEWLGYTAISTVNVARSFGVRV